MHEVNLNLYEIKYTETWDDETVARPDPVMVAHPDTLMDALNDFIDARVGATIKFGTDLEPEGEATVTEVEIIEAMPVGTVNYLVPPPIVFAEKEHP